MTMGAGWAGGALGPALFSTNVMTVMAATLEPKIRLAIH